MIYQANHHALEVILRHTNCFNSPKDSFLAALEQAEDNVAERHPRAVSITVLKADLSQRCYDMHTSTANAKSDARCCLAIILTLVKLNYLTDAEGVSRIEAVERNYDRFSQSRSNEDSIVCWLQIRISNQATAVQSPCQMTNRKMGTMIKTNMSSRRYRQKGQTKNNSKIHSQHQALKSSLVNPRNSSNHIYHPIGRRTENQEDSKARRRKNLPSTISQSLESDLWISTAGYLQ